MELFAYGAVVVVLLIAAYLFNENTGLHKRIVALSEELTDAKSKRPAASKPAKSEEPKAKVEAVTVAADPELERDLDDARSEIKDLKKQIYDLKKGSKELKQEVKEAREDRGSDVLDPDMMFELREEIAELKAENARLEDAVKNAKKSSRSEAPAPKKEEPAPAPAPVAAAPTGNVDLDALRAKYEKELDGLRTEVRDLDRKLKSTASNVDKQRRRADNNDRAYKITQRQYDAAQERVELLDAQLKKAGFAAAPAAEAAPAAKPTPTPPTKPALSIPKPAAPTPPPKPAAAVADVGAPAAPKPEVGSTTVLSSKALASVSKPAPEEPKEDKTDSTLQYAKPVTAADIAAAAPKPEATEEQDDADGFESGGHTAMLTPGALAANMRTQDEPNEQPEADESGGHTAVLSSASLSRAVTGEAAKMDEASEPEAEEVEEENPRETAERTAILSPAAFAKAEEPAEEEPVASEPPGREEPEGGRRPSSGLFGMPANLLSTPPEEEPDPVRSTQFAFPTQIVDDNEPGGTAKFAPISGARLGGSSVGDNPADKPVPDANDDASKADRLGGRLGDLDLGDLNSAIDDAWGDLDVD